MLHCDPQRHEVCLTLRDSLPSCPLWQVVPYVCEAYVCRQGSDGRHTAVASLCDPPMSTSVRLHNVAGGCCRGMFKAHCRTCVECSQEVCRRLLINCSSAELQYVRALGVGVVVARTQFHSFILCLQSFTCQVAAWHPCDIYHSGNKL